MSRRRGGGAKRPPQAPARGRSPHGLDCGCSHIGLMAGTGICSICGGVHDFEIWMPTGASLGSLVMMAGDCRWCPGEWSTLAQVVALDAA